MTLRRFLPTNRLAQADRSPLEARTDSVRPPEYSLMDTLAEENYIHYRIYTEDGAIPSKTPAPGDPFLGRIKARSVPPPHTVKAVKHSIAKVENIEDRTSTRLFLTPYTQSPMGDAVKVTIHNRSALGSTPQEPLALVAKMSESERRALESGRRGRLASAAEPDTTPEIRYLYYQLYADDYEMASKVAIDPEKPSLGRIRADSVAPPHSPASIRRCISRVERTPALAHADLFADISCDTPLKERHISILRIDSDYPGLSPNKPMAVVQRPPKPVGILWKNREEFYSTAGLSLMVFIILVSIDGYQALDIYVTAGFFLCMICVDLFDIWWWRKSESLV